MTMFANILLKRSLFESFTYKVPDSFSHYLKEGFAVLVPLKRSLQIGFVERISRENRSHLDDDKLREIVDIFPVNPLFDSRLFDLLLWASEYYLEPAGNMTFSAVPSGIFRLNNYKVRFLDDTGGKHDGTVSLSRLVSSKMGKKVSLFNVYKLLQEKRAVLEVCSDGGGRESFVEFCRRSDDEQYKEISRKYPVIERFIEMLGAARIMPLYEALTIVRDRRILRYLYKSGIVKIVDVKESIGSYVIQESPVLELTDDQKRAISDIETVRKNGFAVHYLYGVTGSGKTEVYLRVARLVLSEGKTAIFLVPEIGLTPQSISRIRGALGCDVAVLHSGLYERERIKEYLRIRDGEVKVVVGARSAVFAPIANIGLIVVDEEHDTAYKQEESPRYNGRDIAIKRGQIEGALVLLGSATPSVQSIYNINCDRFTVSRLLRRVNDNALPEIEVVELKREIQDEDDVEKIPFYISENLYRNLIETINGGHKAILMLNRRGFSTLIVCSKCGYVFTCPNCDIRLVYHKKGTVLLCHFCGYVEEMTEICPSCNTLSLRSYGFGTEQVEDTIKKIIPGAKTVRLDRDAISNLYELESSIAMFSRGDANILIGTQMVAKGHHFPDVTLVGVVFADMAFSVPDFRVSERLLQLLMQVSGRAGRGDMRGRVIIQTFRPFEPAITAAVKGDIDEFANIEIQRRKNLFYPPFSRVILIRARSVDERRSESLLNIVKDGLIGLKRTVVLGPIRSPIMRIKNEYRFQLMIKTTEQHKVRKMLRGLLPGIYRMHHNVRISVDVDPINML